MAVVGNVPRMEPGGLRHSPAVGEAEFETAPFAPPETRNAFLAKRATLEKGRTTASVIRIDIADRQSHVSVDRPRLREAVLAIVEAHNISRAEISVAIIDDAGIRTLHDKYLDDDTPTDVLSFLLEKGDGVLEGEVVVSAETAIASATLFEWPAEHELLLYVVHGMLHLVGLDDATPNQRAEMRREEQAVLARLGIEARYDETDSPLAPRIKET